MTTIDEVCNRLLATLEESWEQNIFTLINTVFEPPSRSDLVEFCEAVRSLHRKGLAQFSWDTVKPGRCPPMSEAETVEFLRSMESWFVLADDGYWTCSKGDFGRMNIPQVVIGEAGALIGLKLEYERGTEWWTARSQTLDRILCILLAEWNPELVENLTKLDRTYTDQMWTFYGLLKDGVSKKDLKYHLLAAERMLPELVPNRKRVDRLAGQLLQVEIPEDR